MSAEPLALGRRFRVLHTFLEHELPQKEAFDTLLARRRSCPALILTNFDSCGSMFYQQCSSIKVINLAPLWRSPCNDASTVPFKAWVSCEGRWNFNETPTDTVFSSRSTTSTDTPALGETSSICSSFPTSPSSHWNLSENHGEALASRGSLLHGMGLCTPCAWFGRPSGCWRSRECMYCHVCTLSDAETRARRRKLERRVLARKGSGRAKILRKREKHAAEVDMAVVAMG